MQGKSVEILCFFAVVFVRADPALTFKLSCRPHGRHLLVVRGPHFEITYRCVAFILLSSDRLLPGLCVLFCPRLWGSPDASQLLLRWFQSFRQELRRSACRLVRVWRLFSPYFLWFSPYFLWFSPYFFTKFSVFLPTVRVLLGGHIGPPLRLVLSLGSSNCHVDRMGEISLFRALL